jgi:hypothetical protein
MKTKRKIPNPLSYYYALEDDFGIVAIIAWGTLATAVMAKLAIQKRYNELHQTDCLLSMRQATEWEILRAQEINRFGDLPQRPIGRFAIAATDDVEKPSKAN